MRILQHKLRLRAWLAAHRRRNREPATLYTFDPSEDETAVLAEIRLRESGDRYNALCGGGEFQDYAHFPRWAGYRGSHASGAYQLQPATFRLAQSYTHVTDFSPMSQDICALWLLRKFGPNSPATWASSGPYSDIATA